MKPPAPISAVFMTTISLLTLCAGCQSFNSTILLKPEDYQSANNKAIVVFTKDRREIEFKEGRHTFVTRRDSSFLEGTGMVRSVDGTPALDLFIGDIPEQQIERVEVRRDWNTDRFGGAILAVCILIPLAYYGLR